MKKIMQRLLAFVIGFPIVLGLALLPHFNHLAVNLLTLVLSALGAVELSVLFTQKKLYISKTEAFILGALPSAAQTAVISFNCNELIVPAFFTAGVFWILLTRIFSGIENMDRFINRLAAGFAVLIYPGLLMEWIVRMSKWRGAGIIILVFLFSVIINDSSAWLCGMLFGKGNRGIIPASPNKSAAGFIGGVAASVVSCAAAAFLWPGIFMPRYDSVLGMSGPLGGGIILGLLSGIAAILGDLAESAVKRSSGLKDPGGIMPGRGGILDSVDSVSVAAPVFYLVFKLFFGQ